MLNQLQLIDSEDLVSNVNDSLSFSLIVSYSAQLVSNNCLMGILVIYFNQNQILIWIVCQVFFLDV